MVAKCRNCSRPEAEDAACHGNENDQPSPPPAEEKRKLEALVSSRLREAARHRERGQSLEEIMSELSRNAQERGLTPEKLDDILDEK